MELKILEMPPYYLPEQISSTHLTADLTQGLVKQGFVIENHVPTPCRGVSDEVREQYKKIRYEEQLDGNVVIHRFPMWKEGRNPLGRAVRYFAVNLIQSVTCENVLDADLVMGSSTPPTQGLLCGHVAKKLSRKKGKKVPFLYLLQDVFPDSLVTTGLAKENGILWKIGRLMENDVYRNADRIIVIGDGIRQNILAKGVPEEKIRVISNWVDTDAVYPVERENNSIFDEFSIDRNQFLVCYAGNLGAAQGTGILLEAAKRLADREDIHFVIFGRGRDYGSIERKITEEKLKNISLFPVLPESRVAEVYSLGDINLITCKKGTGNSALPSKLWSTMACNSRIVASFDTDSDMAGILSEANAGVCVEAENAEALCEAILNEYHLAKTNRAVSGAREYVLRHASKEVCVAQYVQVIQELAV